MIYLDNAATGGFKPNSVIETATNAIKFLNTNAGRSGHRLSKTGAGFIYSCRKKLSEFFNNLEPERVVFTKNCTEALNLAIYGCYKKNSTVITTCFEHNSVLRPLHTLEKLGLITLKIVYPQNGELITSYDVSKAFTSDTSLVVVNHVSNVNGTVNDVDGIGEFLKDKNCTFLVDGAQSAGHIKIDMQKSNIDALAVAGHKGLYSVQGSGALIFKNSCNVLPVFQGGTGTETFNLLQPDSYPERLESGTLNLPSICALEEGVRYIESSIDYISIRLSELTLYLIEKLSLIKNVKIYSKKNPSGIVAFEIKNLSSIEVSEILSDKYDIAVRGGFHCAPLMNKFLNTASDGLVRVSICPHKTKRDLFALSDAIKSISRS